MRIKPYLIFNLHQRRYAIAAKSVTEIFLLPELMPIAEAPPDIVGLLQLHGDFVPVMHLDLRFGHRLDRCHLTDNVIMVESQGLRVGVIVHQVETVIEIDDRYIQSKFDYGREHQIERAFIRGAIDLDDETIILLDTDNLVRYQDVLQDLTDAEVSSIESAGESVYRDFYDRYFVSASAQTQKILQQRAIDLKKSIQEEATTKLTTIAVVSIEGKYFGLDIGVVREFINLKQITRIPCCPEHIVGNMNLRGEILTIVDVCQPLNIAKKGDRGTKCVVVEADGIVAGILVEEVYDVVDFSLEELRSLPVATEKFITYLKQIADYQARTLNIVDLPKLLASGVMTVEMAA